MKSRLRKNNAGMSLVEVLIAMVMLAVISVPLIKYFTDSLNHSIKTAQKQQATAEAQSLMEELQSQYMLVHEKRDNTGKMVYDAYYLSENPNYTEVNGMNDTGFDDDGLGRQTYVKEGTDFDYEVIVETEMDFNTTGHPAINAVDDTTDVFAAETNQLNEALLHFQAANQAYASKNGVPPISLDQIKQSMTKTIHVVIAPSTSGYRVNVYYEYKCSGPKWKGLNAVEYYISNSLYVGEKKELKNIYILYNRKDCRVRNEADVDWVEVTGTVTITPKLYLVCQNPQVDSNYTVRYKALTGIELHSNIGNTQDSTKGVIKPAAGGSALSVLPITGDESSLRISGITVNVYKHGYDPEKPEDATLYVTMSSTKGE